MIALIEISLLLMLFSIYVGYPLAIWILAAVFPYKTLKDDNYEPYVTLMISAYNEEKDIGSKIENSLSLDYPKEKIKIVVVSDCSSDNTDKLVQSYAEKGVKLVRSSERRGKTAALNQAMESISSEVVVFSDANAIYDKQSIRKLVRHFFDKGVGYVVGYAHYEEKSKSAAGSSEGIYWNFELKLKQSESAFSSVVGGDGAIYAIRKFLYEPMKNSDINDFVNPLQIIVKGYRGVFDKEAFCVERPAGKFDKEFSRKVRIVNRSFNAFLRVPQASNPFKVGLFAFQLVFHKVLRWFSPYLLFALIIVLFSDIFIPPIYTHEKLQVGICLLLIVLAAIGWILDKRNKSYPLFYIPYYFVLMNIASALGIFIRLQGKVITTWNTVRQDEHTKYQFAPLLPRIVLSCLLLFFLLFILFISSDYFLSEIVLSILIFLIIYTYAGYHGLLKVLTLILNKKIITSDDYLPYVTLLIVAYNEEKEIEKKLCNSLALDYPKDRLRILIASDGSSDKTNQIVSKYSDKGIELLSFPKNRGKISALNEAMSKIDSEIVVLSDANVSYKSDAIKKLVRNFNDPKVGLVSGKVTLLNETLSYGISEKSYYFIEHSIQDMEGSLGTLIGADGAMYAIRRSLFIPPPHGTILDDFVISMSIAVRGFLVIHEREALGFEQNVQEIQGELRRKARIIAGGYQSIFQGTILPSLSQPALLFCFISHKLLRWISGFTFVTIILLLGQRVRLMGSEDNLLSLILFILLSTVPFIAFLAQVFPLLRKNRLVNLCYYFSMLMLASLMGIYLAITGRQKVTWREHAKSTG